MSYQLTAPDLGAHLTPNYGRFPVCFVKGEGVWLEDDQGRRYVDCLSGIAVNALGHGHPALVAAIREQAGLLLHTSNLFHVQPQSDLADLICANSFGESIYFGNSGAEANEAAYKTMRLWGNKVHEGRKPRIIAMNGSFHGRTMAALSMTGNPAYHTGFEPMLPVEFVPYGDIDALREVMGDDVAGVAMEPLQGEGGVVVPPAGYLAAVRELCDKHQALLHFDEVQVGIGRCGALFCHQLDGVNPDTMALAKGLGGGVPIGALVMTKETGDLLQPGTHASTFGGNHLACAAALAVVHEVLKPGFCDAVAARGEQLRAGLAELFPGHEVRGKGLLCGVVMPEAPGGLARACLDQGLVLGTAGGNVLRLAPPLVITEDEIDELLVRLRAAVEAITETDSAL